MKIQATKRLQAVIIKPGAYPNAQGVEDIEDLQDLFKRSRKRIAKDKNGFVFWWVGRNENILVCTDKGKVVAFIELLPRASSALINKEMVNGRSISVTFTDPEYRGRGLMLGMHQYLVTRFNLISDDVYSPEGLSIWKHLKKMGHTIEVTDGFPQKESSWTKNGARLLIRRGR